MDDMIDIRMARDGDWDSISAILREFDLAHESLRQENFFVAERSGKIVGVLHAEPVGDVVYISAVGVVPEFRRRGIGRRLTMSAIGHHGRDVYLYTVIPGYFARQGFEEAAVHPDIPDRSIYGCRETCDPESCVCMRYKKL
jgi:N-acetylglutamate synthase-like GNAT family acetyltransferase